MPAEARSLHPNHSGRCQAMEERRVNERNGKNPLRRIGSGTKVIQCGLPKRHDGAHAWNGRAFGQPSAKPHRSREPGRCTASEPRTLTTGETREVRCTRTVEHDGHHEHARRPFAAPPKRANKTWTKKKLLEETAKLERARS